MKYFSAALLAALAITALPAAAFAVDDYGEPGLQLAPIGGEKIEAGDGSVIIADQDVYVAGVRTVFFDDEPLEVREDYTVHHDNAVVVTFGQTFLEGVKPGRHVVRVEFASHFAETDYVLADTEGDYTAAPPRAKWPR